MPVVSAREDTVTEGHGNAMASLGGIGIMHKNLASRSRRRVDRVKRRERVIVNPINPLPNTPSSGLELMKK